MSGHLRMGPGAEFDAVRALLTAWGQTARAVGDDGALLDMPPGERLVVSTDASVEDVHFRRAWLTPEEIGWRATQAALSDLAAMGATPMSVLVALAVPAAWRAALKAVAEGIGAACRAAAATIVGGDVTGGESLTLSITALGHTRRPLPRSGARAGQTLYVTGRLGGPGAAVHAWEAGGTPDPSHRARFAHPAARLAAGRWCAAHGATAAIDISDGLAGDAGHLAAASGARCVLDLDAIPTLPGVDVADALRSGEEYELLVAATSLDRAAFAAAHDGLELTAVGRVEAGGSDGEGKVVGTRGGVAVPMPDTFNHFAQR